MRYTVPRGRSVRHMRPSAASEGAGYSPSVGFLVTVVERFQFLLPLLLAKACGVTNPVESWCKLHQPARVDSGHLPHVLLGGQHQLMVHKPFWLAVKEGAGGVKVHHLLVNQGTVPIMGVLPGSVPEETAANSFLDPHRSCSTRYHVQLVSVHDAQHLLAYVLSSL